MTDNSVGGNDTLTGGANATTNNLYGDALNMHGNSHGGNDKLIGGANVVSNDLYGDADRMDDNSHGGSDTLTGGANATTNNLYGEAFSMLDYSVGGNDTLTGGNSTNGSADVSNVMYGDADRLSESAKGGNDILTAGTASAGGTVHNDMWGDGELTDSAQGGADQFVFKDNGPMTVGTNNLMRNGENPQAPRPAQKVLSVNFHPSPPPAATPTRDLRGLPATGKPPRPSLAPASALRNASSANWTEALREAVGRPRASGKANFTPATPEKRSTGHP